MILVTLGTQKEQFTRLLDYIEKSSIKDKIIVQAGHTKYDSKKMEIFDFISYEEMQDYIKNADPKDPFEAKLAESMYEFIEQLYKVNVLDERLMHNEKHRSISLFGKTIIIFSLARVKAT